MLARRTHLGIRLALAFALLIGILVTASWLGVIYTARLEADVDEILVQRWQKVQLAKWALRYSARNNRITLQIFLLNDRLTIDLLRRERAENSERISEVIQRIKGQLESENEGSFDPFFTTKGVGRGTGQGLTMVRSVVVDRHGGTIQFETEMGMGTCFIIRLPMKPAFPGNLKPRPELDHAS